MAAKQESPLEAAGSRRRVGCVRGAAPGPLLLCTGGLHGNEPSGVLALERVIAELEAEPGQLRGRLLGLAGNLAALSRRTRYLDVDLNRAWVPERLAAVDTGDGPCDSECHEQRELLGEIRQAVTEAEAEICFLDLHTSSAHGTPFACIGDTLRNRRFARPFPVPVILGLEEQIDGALLEHLNNAGLVTMGFEGGQHDDEESVENHVAAIWIGLAAACCLPGKDPRVRRARELLRQRASQVPPVLEIRYRHGLKPEDDFRMRPGFQNFCEVHAGQVLADDSRGDIEAFYPARVLLPLYQGKGDDGFFLAREVSPFWLRLSRWMRRLRLDRLVHWLPGVRRHPQQPDALLVDQRVARWFTIEVFHLLGFRKRRPEGELLVVSRRAHDLARPDRIRI